MNSSCQVFYSYSSGNIQNIERKMPFPKHIFICMNTNATGRPGRATFRQSQGHFVWEDQHHCWGHDAKIRGRRRRPGGKYQLRRKMEQREKQIKKLALWGFGTKMCIFGLMDSYKFKIHMVDLWTHGLMDSWTYELTDLWTYGLMDLWTYGLMDLWTHGLMDSWAHTVSLRKI